MTKTPRTDAVQTAANFLPYGSLVVIPEGHPPSDPWALARELEVENNKLRAKLAEYGL